MRPSEIKPILQKYRLSVIAMFIFMALAMVSSLVGVDFLALIFRGDKYGYMGPELYMVGGLMAVLGLFLNEYLSTKDQKGPNINIMNNSASEHIDDLMMKFSHKSEIEFDQIRKELEKTKQDLLKKPGDSLSQEQRNDLVATLKNQLLESTSEKLLEDLKEKTGRLLDRDISEKIESLFMRTIKRLSAEINVLEKRARINLIIGSLTAFAGVSIFILFVFAKTGDIPAQTYLVKEFAPRISLVIVIELFAYFFLGLYKSNLSEIKYFHNELTNIEHKHLALEESLASANKTTITEIVKGLAKTERNFLLKKGETTVSLEDRRISLEEHKGIINALVSKLAKPEK